MDSSSSGKLCISEGHCYGILKEVRNNPTCINLSPKLENQKTILGKEGRKGSLYDFQKIALLGWKEGRTISLKLENCFKGCCYKFRNLLGRKVLLATTCFI
jgi:hypothetical protein